MSGLTIKPDDCPVTRTIRAALYATELSPSEDDVIGIVVALKEDFPQLGADLRECICNPGLAECPVHGKGGPT